MKSRIFFLMSFIFLSGSALAGVSKSHNVCNRSDQKNRLVACEKDNKKDDGHHEIDKSQYMKMLGMKKHMGEHCKMHNLKINFEYRPRYEHKEGKDFKVGNVSRTINHRARLNIGYRLRDVGSIFLQFQDVRYWGEEMDTLKDYSADGFDLHQAFVKLNLGQNTSLKVGRQEIIIANHRLVGNVGWTPNARSFDGVVFDYLGDLFKLKGFFTRISDATLSGGSPTENVDFGGVYLTKRFLDIINTGLIVLVRYNEGAVAGNEPTDVTNTTGVIADGRYDGFNFGGEFYYQLNFTEEKDTYAYFYALRGGYTLKNIVYRPGLKLFFERASGATDKTSTFDTMYATNHKFYGEMDFFLNLPVNTDNRGLQDLGITLIATPFKKAKFFATFHNFKATVKVNDDPVDFGNEIDLKLVYHFNRNISIDGLYGIFLPGELMKQLKGVTDNSKSENYFYSTFKVKF